MFKRKDIRNKKDTPNSKSAKFSTIDRIAADTVIEGKITSAKGIRIDGTIIGTVECHGKLVIGKSGLVIGDINCNSADIEGNIESSLVQVKDILHLRSTSNISGDIVSGNLTVDIGAKFSGSCRIEKSVKEDIDQAIKEVVTPKPKLESKFVDKKKVMKPTSKQHPGIKTA